MNHKVYLEYDVPFSCETWEMLIIILSGVVFSKFLMCLSQSNKKLNYKHSASLIIMTTFLTVSIYGVLEMDSWQLRNRYLSLALGIIIIEKFIRLLLMNTERRRFFINTCKEMIKPTSSEVLYENKD